MLPNDSKIIWFIHTLAKILVLKCAFHTQPEYVGKGQFVETHVGRIFHSLLYRTKTIKRNYATEESIFAFILIL